MGGKFQDNINGKYNILMLATSAIYSFFGTIVSVYLYGRKTDYLREIYNEEDSANEMSESDNDF